MENSANFMESRSQKEMFMGNCANLMEKSFPKGNVDGNVCKLHGKVIPKMKSSWKMIQTSWQSRSQKEMFMEKVSKLQKSRSQKGNVHVKKMQTAWKRLFPK